jgi:hypothetical protein
MSKFRTGVRLLLMMSLVTTAPAGAQQTDARAVLRLPMAGTAPRGGEFKGTISINRFERRGNEIVAMGFVAGTLSRRSHGVRTVVAGEIAFPVRVSVGGIVAANGRGPVPPRLVLAGSTADGAPPASFRLAQVTADCPVVTVTIEPQTIDVGGVQVALSGTTIELTGVPGTPFGDLVCEAEDLVQNIAAVVNVLNNILFLLTLLLGGLTGGLPGTIPVP